MTSEPAIEAEHGFELDERRLAALQARFPEQDLDPLKLSLAIGRAALELDRRLSARIRHHDLNPVALQALISVYLADGGPVSLAALGDELRVTKANVSWVLTRLERLGLIARAVDPNDGRRIRATMCEEGTAVVEELVPLSRDLMETAFAELEPSEREHARALLRRVAAQGA